VRVAGQYPSVDCAVNDVAEGYNYPPEVRFEFSQQDLDSYRRAADTATGFAQYALNDLLGSVTFII
jgi:hypothetical protein